MDWARLWELVLGFKNDSRSFKKGKQFEIYAEKFFPIPMYDLIHVTADYKTNHKRFVESSLKPDFLFRDRLTRKIFYVECKFRSSLYEGKVQCCKNTQQLARYRLYHQRIPVYLFIGLGGRPARPRYLFLVPINQLKQTGLAPSAINIFQISRKPPVHLELLKKPKDLNNS